MADAPPPRKVKPATKGGDRAKAWSIYVGIGVIIVAISLFMPSGLAGTARLLRRRLRAAS